jgi:uracil phosphoribosyltransferase
LIKSDLKGVSSFIIDTYSGMKIACKPHIVDKELEKLCLDSAREFINVLEKMDFLVDSGNNLAVLEILRAGPGYNVSKALEEKKFDFSKIHIRPEYSENGYRSHETEKRMDIQFRDYSQISFSKSDDFETLIIPDTFATGRSAETSLNDLLKKGPKPKKIVLYGFIAIPSLARLASLTNKNGIELIGFAIGNIMELAFNNYDMPLYGIDESYYAAMQNKSVTEQRLMGSIVDKKTLKRYIPNYIAGLDQPGDWSERQANLFTGDGYEKGDIAKHLRNSQRMIETLKHINSTQSWYNKQQDALMSRELEKIEETLAKYI